MSKDQKKKTLLFTIDGFEVYDNSTYLIADKKDGDAPSGFIDAGVSKLPSDGVGETFQCPYHRTSATTGVWDSGFFTHSPCYGDMDIDEQKTVVKALKANVLDPYRKFMGNADLFEPGVENDKFLEKLSFEVHSGKIYNTGNPVQRMELYMAIHSRTVVPQGMEGSSKYREAFYVVYDTTKKTKQKEEADATFFKAAKVFTKLYENSREELYAVLAWIGMPKLSPTLDEDTLISIFSSYIKTSNDRPRMFLDTVAETENTTGKAKIMLYKELKEMSIKGIKLKKTPAGIWFYGDNIEVGADLKSAAENIAKNSALSKVRDEILYAE